MLKKFVFYTLLVFLVGTTTAQEKIFLWQDTNIKNWKQVTLTPYLSQNNTSGTAIIVCPGGSYFWLDMETEGDGVAKWLQSNGISAFVLKYRVAGFSAFFWNHRSKKHGNQYPDMLNDAQQAITWVRNHAKEYHIKPNKVGIMGFSAGGH
ncbi:MAG: alpha/beta hydrolase, partial [Bacteroidales bacterium]|nr:alpha/beta hydrolase [Bacteroidales bacterium]